VLDPAGVRFVLVRTRAAGNVGAAARAIKNFGFARLDLADPACDATDDAARRMAVDAQDVLQALRVWPDLDAALGGARTVVGTSRRTGKHRRPHYRLEEAAPAMLELARAGEVVWLFGPEDHGLRDDELDRCTHLVHVPTSHALPSLNVAQAVLLAAYEMRRAAASATEPAESGVEPPAEHAEREAMYAHLERSLVAIGFLGRDSRDVLMRRLRRALGRAGLTTEEVRMLRGVARQTLWAAARAGLVLPEPEP
jgi:TrmH family RNA methyltransferase